MKQISWFNLLGDTKSQISNFVNDTLKILKEKLVGIYLHGSLAMGCFNPDLSDVDLLIVIEKSMNIEEKFLFTNMILKTSKNPIPLELSILKLSDFEPWKYPTPFEFHYSEDWRYKLENELNDGSWQKWDKSQKVDPDLAAHIMVTRRRGVCLYGKETEEVFPEIPFSDYLDSIVEDTIWALNNDLKSKNPVYLILNYCRVLAAVSEKKVLSKYEGGKWALENLPQCFASLIDTAIKIYSGEIKNGDFDQRVLDEFIEYVFSLLDL